jgi:hypothetical protein
VRQRDPGPGPGRHRQSRAVEGVRAGRAEHVRLAQLRDREPDGGLPGGAAVDDQTGRNPGRAGHVVAVQAAPAEHEQVDLMPLAVAVAELEVGPGSEGRVVGQDCLDAVQALGLVREGRRVMSSHRSACCGTTLVPLSPPCHRLSPSWQATALGAANPAMSGT